MQKPAGDSSKPKRAGIKAVRAMEGKINALEVDAKVCKFAEDPISSIRA